MIYVNEEYMKWLENMCNEYFKEGKKLIERKERYTKKGKDIPKNLDKRISECSALYDYYDGLIKQNVEAKLDIERRQQEVELRKSLSAVGIGCNITPLGFNSFYGMSPFVR